MTNPKLRSQEWFDDRDNAAHTANYIEKFLANGFTRTELQSGRPIIGIAQTGSDLSPCNRHHVVLAQRVREGIRDAGGVAIEFPVHPIQESVKRPTAGLDRNLTYLSLVEVLYGYPLDGTVLMIGCDKTTPALLMGAATVDLPAIALSVGPTLSGRYEERRAGSGTIIWELRDKLAVGEIDYDTFIDIAAASAPSVGYCNTMGTATTMNSLAEVLGMQLPGSAAIPAPYSNRQEMAYRTGVRIVEMVLEDLKPSDIMTKESFENAIVVNSAIGGSTNAPVHINAIARHIGIDITLDDWERKGRLVPHLVNLQPSGEYLGEDYYHAGGVPAVVNELMKQGLIAEGARTVNGKTLGQNCANTPIKDEEVIRPFDRALMKNAGFIVLRGNLFDSAIMKTSAISDEFRKRYLSDPERPDVLEGRAVVFDGPEEYSERIDDPSLAINEHSLMFMRGTGPIGYPGSAEVVNMRPPSYLITVGVNSLPCIGDGRQSGTSGSPSILHASPEAAAGGNLAILRTGDQVRIDLCKGRADVLISNDEIARRWTILKETGGYKYPESQTPWQEIQRGLVDQLDTGAVLKSAVSYQRISRSKGIPRHNE